MADGKRILVLTPQLPHPPRQGTAIRNYNLIVHLADRHKLHLLSFAQEGDHLAPDSPLLGHCLRIETVAAPRRKLAQRLLYTAVSPLPDVALRLASLAFKERLTDLIRQEMYDVVQIEGIEHSALKYTTAVDGPRIATVRSWHHDEKTPPELHVVCDLVSEGVTLESLEVDDNRIVIRFSGP